MRKPKYKSGGVSYTGYLPNSPDRFNEYNIIPSDIITMQGVPHDILAIADNGQTKIMKKNSGLHKFIGARAVTEIPLRQAGGLVPYAGGVEKTPTGMDNAFANNQFNLTIPQLYELASKYGFRTTNNQEFQTDLESYLKTQVPQVYNEVMTKFGQTKAGKFADGILGARTMYAAGRLIPQSSTTVVQPQQVPNRVGYHDEQMLYAPNQHAIGFPRVYNDGTVELISAYTRKPIGRKVTREQLNKAGVNNIGNFAGAYDLFGVDPSKYKMGGTKRGKICQDGGAFFDQNGLVWGQAPGIVTIEDTRSLGIKDNVSNLAAVRNQAMGKKTVKGPNVTGAAAFVGALSMAADQLEKVPDHRLYDQAVKRGTSDSLYPTYHPTMSRGFIDMNTGYSVPDQQTITQFAARPAPNYYGQPFVAQDGLGLPEMMTAQATPSAAFAPVSGLSDFVGSPATASPAATRNISVDPNVKVPKKAQFAMDYYINVRGLAPHIAAGIVGNLVRESNLNPKAVEKGNTGNGRGIAQWDVRDRYPAMINWALKNSRDPYDLTTQLDYILEEPGWGKKTLNKLRKTADPVEAALVFGKVYERPNEKFAAWDKRAGAAQKLYQSVIQQPSFKEGGEYDLTEEQIQDLIDQGYQVDIL